MFGTLDLKAKSVVTMGVLAVLVAGVAGGVRVIMADSQAAGEVLVASSVRFSRPMLDLAVQLKDVQFDVVQVQQWLTDVSATRGLDGLDDGFATAETYAKRFALDVKAAKATATALKYDTLVRMLDDVEQRFEPYYATGKRMAEGYVAGGPEVGNTMMSAFDATAEAITEAVGAALDEQADRLDEERAALRAAGTELGGTQGTLSTYATAAAGVIMAILGLIAVGFTRHVLTPLRRIAGSIATLTADGNVDLPEARRADEVGRIALAVHALRDFMRERAAVEAAEAARTDGQLRLAADKEAAVAAFRTDVAAVLDRATAAMARMTAAAGDLAGLSRGADHSAVRAAEEVRGTSGSVQAVSAATEELSASIDEIARLTTEASSKVARTSADMRRVEARMQELTTTAGRIGDIVDLISDIAGQTNLLALNATIEAARAGEAGKGFAVVATEVKALAAQTGRATGEIAQQVNAIQTATNEVAAFVRDVAGDMREVDSSATAIASAVSEQGAAATEISNAVIGAAAASDRVASNVETLRATVGTAASSAADVGAAVDEVSALNARLADVIDRFVRQVAA